MSDESLGERRAYRKRARADQEAQTRLRITEAAVRLHGTIGPARTTVAGLAAEAGVQRATVYRHFPDAESLFMACSSHWASLNPFPDSASWSKIADVDARLRVALAELYEWYAWGEQMLVNVRRDGPNVPAMAAPAAAAARRMAAMPGALMSGRRLKGRARARVAAAIGHALDFGTWRSLVREQGLDPDEAIALMVALVDAASAA
jgi:AcrR family transcriptional regulator